MSGVKSWRIVGLAVGALVGVAGRADATTFNGNGATGFGGPVGLGALTVTDDGAGNVTFSFLSPSGSLGGSSPSNDLVIYLSTGAPGLTDTSSLTNDVDRGDLERRAVSGSDPTQNTATQVNFASGFQASYVVAIQDDFVNLFALPQASSSNRYLTYITGASQQPDPSVPHMEPDTLTFPLADLGLTQGSSFSLVGTLISTQVPSTNSNATPAYRSNETIGDSLTLPGPDGGTNAGSTGTVTFSDYDTYTSTQATPEPASLPLLALALGGTLAGRRRRHQDPELGR